MAMESGFDDEVVVSVARGWLSRRCDLFTRRNLDDFVQETALRTWQARESLRDRERLAAFARTIAQRMRYHELRRHHRLTTVGLEVEDPIAPPDDRDAGERWFRVADTWVDAEWLKAELRKALAGLGSSQRAVLQEFYAGSTCRDIGGRLGLTEGCVKQRLFRARSRVRADLEARARCAGLVDVPTRQQTAVETAGREAER